MILAVKGKVEEGLVEVKAIVAMAIVSVAIWLSIIHLPVTVVIGTFFLIGQNLDLR